MEEIHESQLEGYSQISKLFTNYKKAGKDRLTKSYIETRLEALETYWSCFKGAHASLIVAKAEQKAKFRYFTENIYDKCFDLYLDLKTLMREKLDELSEQKKLTQQPQIHHVEQQQPSVTTKLPAIHLPTFSGDYREWLSFHDVFKSLVHDNTSLSNVNKCQYLKSSLQGEAENLVKQIQVSDANYDIIWSMLTKRYDNKRSIVNYYIGRLLNQRRMTSESSKSIRELLDVTTECLATLKGLNLPTDSWDDLIVYILIQKLDSESHRMFEQLIESCNNLPTWTQLSNFLEHRFRTLELVKPKETSHLPRAVHQVKSFITGITPTQSCLFCEGEHLTHHCEEFCKLDLASKKEYVQKNQMCFNCLRKGHAVKMCLQSTRCRICGQRHHTLIHGRVSPREQTQSEPTQSESTEISTQTMTAMTHTTRENSTPQSQSQVILATALVNVQSHRDNTTHTLRALIDQGSQACLITEASCQVLGLNHTPVKGVVTGVGATKSTTRARVEFDIKSRDNNPKQIARVSAYVLTSLTSYVPERITTINWPQLRELELADPTLCNPGRIDLILGADVYADILQDGMITLKDEKNCLIAQRSTLGWIVSGKTTTNNAQSHTVNIHHVKVELDTLLRQFWELEENPERRTLSNLEIKCENHYKETHQRAEDGHYTVRMPFITRPPDIGESITMATKRFANLEGKFKKQQELHTKYKEFMDDYLNQHHMEPASPDDAHSETVCYLPHHAIVNEQHITTKLRVVFDSSAKTSNGKSLNENLMIGPALQNDLRDVTMRWRRHRVVIVSDIRQMFRRLKMDERDRDYQRILWRFNTEDEIQHYRLTTVTYGTSCAPYLAIKTLRQLAEDERENFDDEVIDTVLTDFYTDDLLTGDHSLTRARDLKANVTKLLEKGGFSLHKWASNSTEIEGAPPDTRKILGLGWNGQTDNFELRIEIPSITKHPTKRSVLCSIASIFDPAGWLAPVVVVAKIILQRLWMEKLDWDEPLPDHILQQWKTYYEELVRMPTIQLKRWFGIDENTERVELHGFSDASTMAYCAIIYCRVVTPTGITVTIVEAKTKVAPVKQVSLPRLELCGAVLLANLLHRVKNAMNIPIQDIYAWTDATIVLAWLQRPASYWATFVANRVTEITNVVDKDRWHHVQSQENPADVASRGIAPSELPHHQLWWNGPTWLHDGDALPTMHACAAAQPTELEKKVSSANVHSCVVSELKSICANSISVDRNQCKEDDIMDRYSTLSRLIRVVAYILRFCSLVKHRVTTNSELILPAYLTTAELKGSLLCLVKRTQNKEFSKEINVIKEHSNKFTDLKRTENGKKIVCLNPFLDDDNVLRVGGRLEFSNLTVDQKHPIILTKNCRLSYLIVKDVHNKTLHGGIQLTLNVVRSKFHIIGSKSLVKKVVHACITCCRHDPKLGTQLMGNLPKDRVTPQRPFSISGIDFAGPVILKSSMSRSTKTFKAYIALFICTAVKAVHLELVTSLSSDAFLAAFRRFTARRGHCYKLISDCGTNFVGASKELKSLFIEGNKNLPVEIANLLAKDGTEWQFNPPGAPHMGGLWERNIRSSKMHLNRILNDTKLTYEEYSTLLCQVESCLNSRPLTPLSEETDEALTPGHFLIGEAPIIVPDKDLEEVKVPYLQRWVYIQQKLQSFWKKWSTEYLVELQRRSKWTSVQDNFKRDDMVIIKDSRLPPAKWLMGRIVETHPGNDGLVRVVSIRCKDNVIKRPVHKLCLLPVNG